jgi:Zn-dependent peptidase ImmA (M78 family)/transcriptional regulator with XRE-family HTH domain
MTKRDKSQQPVPQQSNLEHSLENHVLDVTEPVVLGARLQEVRRARGLTQQTVADEMEMARTTLVAIEKGERRITPHELLRLAAMYGRPVSEFVTRQAITEGLVPQFRSAWREDFLHDAQLQDVAAELQRLGENYVELETMCNLPMARTYPLPYDISKSSPERAAEEVATAERNRLGIGDGPLSNLRDRFENDVGLRIFFFLTPAKISGVFAYNDALGGCIGINANHPRDRRNWSLAHEYGHFLTNRYQAEVTFLAHNRRQSHAERFADAFAENFLMPADGLNRRFTEMHRSSSAGSITLAQICTLAHLYRVSVQALILRLERLRRFPSGTWDRLQAEGFKPRRAQELLGLDANPTEEHLLPRRYINLAVMAFEQELLSEGQFAKMLRTDRVSARVILEQISGRVTAEEESGYTRLDLELAHSLEGR